MWCRWRRCRRWRRCCAGRTARQRCHRCACHGGGAGRRRRHGRESRYAAAQPVLRAPACGQLCLRPVRPATAPPPRPPWPPPPPGTAVPAPGRRWSTGRATAGAARASSGILAGGPAARAGARRRPRLLPGWVGVGVADAVRSGDADADCTGDSDADRSGLADQPSGGEPVPLFEPDGSRRGAARSGTIPQRSRAPSRSPGSRLPARRRGGRWRDVP